MGEENCDPCEGSVPNGSYDSSGGIFPNGYCVWDTISGTVVSTHCVTGYVCGNRNPEEIKSQARFGGDLLRLDCRPASN